MVTIEPTHPFGFPWPPYPHLLSPSWFSFISFLTKQCCSSVSPLGRSCLASLSTVAPVTDYLQEEQLAIFWPAALWTVGSSAFMFYHCSMAQGRNMSVSKQKNIPERQCPSWVRSMIHSYVIIVEIRQNYRKVFEKNLTVLFKGKVIWDPYQLWEPINLKPALSTDFLKHFYIK